MTDNTESELDLPTALHWMRHYREGVGLVAASSDNKIERLEAQLTAMTAERDRAVAILNQLTELPDPLPDDHASAYAIHVAMCDLWGKLERISRRTGNHCADLVKRDRAALERVEKQDEATWVANASAYLAERVDGRG